jgi:hypothetical protein
METYIAAGTAVLVSCIFPFVFHFFKKNERLHENTASKVGQHETLLAIHEVKINSLESWRNMHNPPGTSVTTTTTAVNS